MKKIIIVIGVLLVLAFLPIPLRRRGWIYTCAHCRMYTRENHFLGIPCGPEYRNSFTDFYEKNISEQHEHDWILQGGCAYDYNLIGMRVCISCARSDPIARLDTEDQVKAFKRFPNKEPMKIVLNAMAAADKDLRQKQVQALNELVEASENLSWDDWWRQNGRFFGKKEGMQEAGDNVISVEAASKDPLDFVLLAVEHMNKEFQSYDIMELLTETAVIHYRAGRDTLGDAVLSKSLYFARTQGSHGLVKCALEHIANKLIECGKTENAKVYLQEAAKEAPLNEDKRWRAASVASLANNYISLGNKEKAYSLLKDAAALIDIINDSYWESDTYCDMAEIYAKLGEKDKGLNLLQKAFDVSVKVEGELSLGSALARVVDSYAKLGEIERASQIAETILEPMMRNAAFYHVATALLQQGNVERALEIVKECKGVHHEAEVLLEIAEANLRANERDQALERIASAERLVGSVTEEISQVRIKVHIGALYHKAAKSRKASELLRAVSDHHNDWLAIQLAAEALAEIGDYEGAIKSACKLTEKKMGVETLVKVALYMAKGEKIHFEMKLQLLKDMIASLEWESGR